MSKCPVIVPYIIDDQGALDGNTTKRDHDVYVKINCQNGYEMLNAYQVVRCNNGTWIPEPFKCTAIPPEPEGLTTIHWIIIACSIAAALIITILIIALCCYRRRRRDRERVILHEKHYVHHHGGRHPDRRSWSDSMTSRASSKYDKYNGGMVGSSWTRHDSERSVSPARSITKNPHNIPGGNHAAYPNGSLGYVPAAPPYALATIMKYYPVQSPVPWKEVPDYSRVGYIPRPQVRPLPYYYGYLNPYAYRDPYYTGGDDKEKE